MFRGANYSIEGSFMKNIISKKSVLMLALVLVFVSGVNTYAQKKEVFVPASSRQVIHGKVTDENGKPIIAAIQVWYKNMTSVVMSYGDSKVKGRTDNLISMSFTTGEGYYSVKVPADTLLLVVSKGPEWSLVKQSYIVKQKEFNGIEFNVKLKRLYNLEKLGWYAGDVHHHSIYSDGYQTPAEVAVAMQGAGLSWGVLSDHNSDEGTKEWLSTETKGFLPIHGHEITTEPSDISKDNGYGHLNQSFIEKGNGKNYSDPNIWARARFDGHEDVQAMIDNTHKQKGFIAINHPFQSWDWSGRYKSWGKVKNFDAIEVWNGEPPHSFTTNDWDTNHININTWSIQAWFSYLNAGMKMPGIAGSDCHDIYGINAYPKGEFYWTTTTGNARTYAHIAKFSRNGIQKSLTEGNLFLTSSFGPLLIVNVNGKAPGGVVKVGKDGRLNISVEVLANQPLLKTDDGVRVIFNGIIVKKLATDEVYTSKQNVSINVEKDGWVILEAFGKWPMYAITNAVYVDYPPYGDNFSKTWKDPADADKWNQFLGRPQNFLPDGPGSSKDLKESANRK
jgi:hypothetical protein